MLNPNSIRFIKLLFKLKKMDKLSSKLDKFYTDYYKFEIKSREKSF